MLFFGQWAYAGSILHAILDFKGLQAVAAGYAIMVKAFDSGQAT